MKDGTQKISLSTYLRTARAHAPLLVSREHARFVTLGWKEKDGETTQQRAVKVYVSNKPLDSEMNEYDILPKRLQAVASGGKVMSDTIPVDVVCLNDMRFKLLGIQGGDQLYLDSLRVKGTCAIVDDNGFAFTNAHVTALPGQDATGMIVTVVSDSNADSGQVYAMSALRPTGNRIDVAVIELSSHDAVDSWMVSGGGNLAVTGPVANLNSDGAYEYFSGSDHVSMSSPEPSAHPIYFQISVGGEFFGFTGFYLLQVNDTSSAKPRPGHSGSLLLKVVGNERHPAGLVFGAVQSNDRTLVCAYPWTAVQKWLGSIN